MIFLWKLCKSLQKNEEKGKIFENFMEKRKKIGDAPLNVHGGLDTKTVLL